MSRLRGAGIEGAALRAAVGPAEQEPRDHLASTERALHALELISGAPGPLPAKALAQTLGASLGSVYRVLHTLEREGYVVRLGHGCYGLGPKLSLLFQAFQQRIDLSPARPVMADLADEVEEDVYLAVLRGGEVAVVEIVRGARERHLAEPGVGFTRLAHSTAIGKVLLTGCSDETIDDYLAAHQLEAVTPRTLVDPGEIRRGLATVRERGIGLDLEEMNEGWCCVAAPVTDAWGATVASIGLSVPTERFRAERQDIIRLCTTAAERVSRTVAPTPEGSPPGAAWRIPPP
jgi:DNA-binding IclR family transcriptional regulator